MGDILRRGTRAASAALLVVTAACAQQDGPSPESAQAGVTTTAVELREWSVVPDESSAAAGEVVFDVENTGEKNHEFMVVATDLDLTQLPMRKDGSFDMEGDGVEVVDATNAAAHGEAEGHAELEPGNGKEFAYELQRGGYVLMCNLVEETDDEDEVHFALGMRIPFEVTER